MKLEWVVRDKNGRFIKGTSSFWKGKKFSDEFKEKLSIIHKQTDCGKNLPSRKVFSHQIKASCVLKK